MVTLLLLNKAAARGAAGRGPAAGGLTACRGRLTVRRSSCLIRVAMTCCSVTAGGGVNAGARYQRLAEAAATIAAHTLVMLLVCAAAAVAACCCRYMAGVR